MVCNWILNGRRDDGCTAHSLLLLVSGQTSNLSQHPFLLSPDEARGYFSIAALAKTSMSELEWGYTFSPSLQFRQFRQFSHSVRTNCSTPGLSVHHQLLEFTQTQVDWVGDAIQPSHPLSSPSPPVFNLSQHQGLLRWVSSSNQVARVLEFQLQHHSFQWIFRTDFL